MLEALRRGARLPRDALTFADYKLGRDVFGNTNKLTCAWPGKLAEMRAQGGSDIAVESLEYGEYADQLRKQGIVELADNRDEDVIEEIEERLDEIISSGEYSYTRGAFGEEYTYGVSSDDFDFAEEIPAVSGILTEDIAETLRGYYGSEFKPIRVNIWRNHHVPEDVVEKSEVFSNYWHTDPHTTDHVKLFVNLTDVTEDHGPFHSVSLGDSYDITNRYKRQRDGVPNGRVEVEASEIMKFTGEAGKTALCNTTLNLHRAGIPAEDTHRDLLQIVFAPTKEPFSENWLREVDEKALTGADHNGFRRLFRY